MVRKAGGMPSETVCPTIGSENSMSGLDDSSVSIKIPEKELNIGIEEDAENKEEEAAEGAAAVNTEKESNDEKNDENDIIPLITELGFNT